MVPSVPAVSQSFEPLEPATAHDDAPAPAMAPMATTLAVAWAAFRPVASTRTSVASVTLPSSWAVVRPPDCARGSETPTPTRPPVAASETDVAVNVDSAVKRTNPVLVMSAAVPAVADTRAEEVTSASDPALVKAIAPSPRALVLALACRAPSAFTWTLPDCVTVPSSRARTAPDIRASVV